MNHAARDECVLIGVVVTVVSMLDGVNFLPFLLTLVCLVINGLMFKLHGKGSGC